MATDSNAIKNWRYRECGNGFPLVLVHGYLGGGEQWQHLLTSPPTGFRVISISLPGFGDNSDLIPPESIGEFARLTLDFLEAWGITRFFLLGHSMGGMIVQDMIKQQPQRVIALILYATGALGVIPGRFESMEESRRRVLTDGTEKAAARLPAKWLVAGQNSPHYSFAAKIAKQAGMAAHLAGLTAMESWDGRAMLANIAGPTLIIWGTLDQSYRRDQIDCLHNHIPDATLQIIINASHLAHLEFPRQFNGIVCDFLRKHGNLANMNPCP